MPRDHYLLLVSAAAAAAATAVSSYVLDATDAEFVASFRELGIALGSQDAALGVFRLFEGLLATRPDAYAVTDAATATRTAELAGRTFLPPIRVRFRIDERTVRLRQIELWDGLYSVNVD